MKVVSASIIAMLIYIVFPLSSGYSFAQTDQTISSPPPIEQPMVREGDLAIKLAGALAVGSPSDEVEAETVLGNVGIAPRNGWIADYPVTPDIIGELQKSVRDSASSGKISMSNDEALKKLDEVCSELAVTARPASGAKVEVAKPPRPDNYPDNAAINNYYNSSGPPIVTYYEPPPDYYYLYSWVPYPFWWFGFWYPGYFILNDFHRVVHIHGRVGFVSNHFHDIRNHRMFRVDPISRFRGRTYSGIGAMRMRGSISTGVSRSDRRIFNSQRYRMSPGGREAMPAIRGRRGIDGGSR